MLTAAPVTALGVVAGVGAGMAPLVCAPVALALGLALGVLVASATGAAPEPVAAEPGHHSFGVRALLTRDPDEMSLWDAFRYVLRVRTDVIVIVAPMLVEKIVDRSTAEHDVDVRVACRPRIA